MSTPRKRDAMRKALSKIWEKLAGRKSMETTTRRHQTSAPKPRSGSSASTNVIKRGQSK